jgi:tripartite-type tricarboxylate transporter receptor subunit TctC
VIENAMAKIMAMPDVKAKFSDLGIVPIGSNAKVMNEFFLEENRKWEKIVREGKIQVE